MYAKVMHGRAPGGYDWPRTTTAAGEPLPAWVPADG